MTIYHTYREEEAMTIYHTYREEEAMTLRRLLAVTGTTAALTEEELDEAHDYISYNDWSAQGAAHKKMAGTSASCYPLQGQSWVASSGCAALAGRYIHTYIHTYIPPAYLKVHTAFYHFLGNGKIRRFGCSLLFSGVARAVQVDCRRP